MFTQKRNIPIESGVGIAKIIKASDDKTRYKIGDRKIIMTCKASLTAGIDLVRNFELKRKDYLHTDVLN